MNKAFTHHHGMNTFLGLWLPWLQKNANMAAEFHPTDAEDRSCSLYSLSQTHNHTQYSTMHGEAVVHSEAVYRPV